MDRGGDSAATRPNPRAQPNQLHVNHDSRKPLFSNNAPRISGNGPQSTSASVGTGARPGALGTGGGVGLTRRAKSDPQSTASVIGKAQEHVDPNASTASILTPGGSRIPRPNSISGLQHRRPISLAEAFKLAQEEEEEAELQRQQGGSPSPAPRVWRARPGQPQDEFQARKMLAEDHDPLDSRARARERQYIEAEAPGAQATELGTDASNRGNGPSLQDRINEWRTKSRPSADWAGKSPEFLADTSGEAHLPELVPGIEDVPFQSVESPRRNGASSSPLKDFTWQVDHDFTAGDLQVSDSPRIKVGNNSNKPFANRPSILDRIDIRSPVRSTTGPRTRNTRLDEIRAREVKMEGASFAGQSTLTPQHPRRYTKLEEIRAREAAAEKQIPLPDRNQLRPKNTRLDEIRQREAEGLSRRALAAARLEEIKEKNAMTRVLSPEKGKSRSTSTDAGREHLAVMRPPARPRLAHEDGGERIPDTPVTVFKSHRPKQENIDPEAAGTTHGKGVAAAAAKPNVNERDLLRRLARAASSSPAPEPVNKRAPLTALTERQKPNESEKVVAKPILAGRSTSNGRKSALSSHNRDAESSRPTVGFAGLKRVPSTESAKSKPSSMHSESDPTARIEAEAKLFALRDDYSEPGSARAPSPEPDSDVEKDDVAEATPKPQKHEFLYMETPRVTGAYVDTPVTAKTEKVKEEEAQDIRPLKERLNGQKQAPPKPDATALFRDMKPSLVWRNKDEDTASEPGARGEAASDYVAASATSSAGKKPRSRSLPRSRPSIKNSAKPPSVKDDLRELQRKHNIEDSTMDDLEDILAGRKHASPKLKRLLEELPVKTEDGIDDELKAVEEEIQKLKPENSEDKDISAGEMALYDRMSKTLRTGLLSIHTAKRGIQRLEDQVALAEKQSTTDEEDKPNRPQRRKHQYAKDDEHLPHVPCPESTTESKPTTGLDYPHIPIPRAFHTTFRFLRWLVLVLAIVALWVVAEGAACWKYCRPAACTSTPCVYSYDDPTFGNALPVKIDQWTTGGNGRKLATWVVEELEDWAADVADAMRGRSLENISVNQLSAAERRQHRRRLRKKGLIKSPTKAAPDQTAKWDAWKRTRLERERLRDMGDAAGDGWLEESIGGDERVW